jgi:hypothetical protein
MDAGQAYRLVYSGVLVLIAILVVYYLITYFFFSDPYASIDLLRTPSASDSTSPLPQQLSDEIHLGQGERFCLSMWMYVSGWSINSEKELLRRRSSEGDLRVYLGQSSNKLFVDIPTTSGIKRMSVSNIDLQKWVHVVISVNSSFVDIYYNGQLVQSKALSGATVRSFPGSNHYTVLGLGTDNKSSLQGYLSKVKLFKIGLTPEDIYSIYQQGPSTSTVLGSVVPGLNNVTFHYRSIGGDNKTLSLFD